MVDVCCCFILFYFVLFFKLVLTHPILHDPHKGFGVTLSTNLHLLFSCIFLLLKLYLHYSHKVTNQSNNCFKRRIIYSCYSHLGRIPLRIFIDLFITKLIILSTTIILFHNSRLIMLVTASPLYSLLFMRKFTRYGLSTTFITEL